MDIGSILIVVIIGGWFPIGFLVGVVAGRLVVRHELKKFARQGADESEVQAFLDERRENTGKDIFTCTLAWPIILMCFAELGSRGVLNKIILHKALREDETVNL